MHDLACSHPMSIRVQEKLWQTFCSVDLNMGVKIDGMEDKYDEELDICSPSEVDVSTDDFSGER